MFRGVPKRKEIFRSNENNREVFDELVEKYYCREINRRDYGPSELNE